VLDGRGFSSFAKSPRRQISLVGGGGSIILVTPVSQCIFLGNINRVPEGVVFLDRRLNLSCVSSERGVRDSAAQWLRPVFVV